MLVLLYIIREQYYLQEFEHLRHIRHGINKRAIPIQSDFWESPVPIKIIYVLQTHNKQKIECIELEDAEKFRFVKNMTYRSYLIRDLGMQPYHFVNSSHLAKNITIKRIIRPQTYCLPELLTVIQKDLEKLNVVLA